MGNTMSAVALTLYVLYLLTAFALRSLLHYRRSGSTGFRGFSGRPGSLESWGGVLFAFAVILGLVAPLLQLLGLLSPIPALDGVAGWVAGLILAVIGIVVVLAAQQEMGTSWRIGVDQREVTALVTSGLFRQIRNPIFTSVITTATGLTLLTPNVLALVGLAALVTAIQLQVRVVEEPYLRATHGRSYEVYAARAGRFLPRLGRLPTTVSTGK